MTNNKHTNKKDGPRPARSRGPQAAPTRLRATYNDNKEKNKKDQKTEK